MKLESFRVYSDIQHFLDEQSHIGVQAEMVMAWVWMKADVGFDGWRFDFVKGYAAEFAKL